MALENDLTGKFMFALLNGLLKKTFFPKENPNITEEMLIEQLFVKSEMQDRDQAALVRQIERLLRRAATENWTVGKLEKHLEGTELTDEQRRPFLRLWKAEHQKIHENLVSQSVWTPNFEKLSWRIDMQKTSREVSHLNEPTAILEFSTQSPSTSTHISIPPREANDASPGQGSGNPIQFELDRAGVAKLLEALEPIEKRVQSLS